MHAHRDSGNDYGRFSVSVFEGQISYLCMHRVGALGGDVHRKLVLATCVSVLWWWQVSVGASDLCLRRRKYA